MPMLRLLAPLLHRLLYPLALLCALPSLSAAQAMSVDTTAVVYAYIQGTDTIAFEGVQLDTTALRGVLVAPDRPRLFWEHQLTDSIPALLSVSLYPPDAPGVALPLQTTDFLIAGDSMVVTVTAQGERSTQRLPTAPGAVPLLGRSMLHTAYLAWFAQQTRRDSLTLFITSSGKTVRAAATVRGEQIVLTVDGLAIISTWNEGTLLEVRVPSQALKVVRLVPREARQASGPVAGRSDDRMCRTTGCVG